MKLDLKKTYKDLYQAKLGIAKLVEVPKQRVISIEGRGNPNTSPEFKDAVEALFPVAYALKFAYKKAGKDYAVMPLEGLWWTEDMKNFSVDNKEAWLWKIFIVQPDFVTQAAFRAAVEEAKRKRARSALARLVFETFDEGTSAQILHVGPFSEEGPPIRALHAFIGANGYAFEGMAQKHHEIYLSDMRKTPPEKMKTIIRQPCRPRGR